MIHSPPHNVYAVAFRGPRRSMPRLSKRETVSLSNQRFSSPGKFPNESHATFLVAWPSMETIEREFSISAGKRLFKFFDAH